MDMFHPLISATVNRTLYYNNEDAVQSVYENLIKDNYRLLRKFDGCYEQFIVYLKKISQQTTLNYRVKEGRYNERLISLDAFFEHPPDDETSLEGKILEDENLDVFHREISKLDPKYREVLFLLSKGYKYKEIAGILHISINTAITRGQRAKKNLKKEAKSEIKLLV